MVWREKGREGRWEMFKPSLTRLGWEPRDSDGICGREGGRERKEGGRGRREGGRGRREGERGRREGESGRREGGRGRKGEGGREGG